MKVLTTLVILISFSLIGCSTTLPIESPICVPERAVLFDISRDEQLSIKDIDPDLLFRIGQNDNLLKGMVATLEGFIQAHDEPLGDCE